MVEVFLLIVMVLCGVPLISYLALKGGVLGFLSGKDRYNINKEGNKNDKSKRS